jgi:hypothetical protein
MWTGDGEFRFAPTLLTLFHQLRQAYPGTGWQNSPQTGSLGDAAHRAEGSASDHNPWLNNTVRALDIAANVSGVPGIVTVTDAPDCEALFHMVNQLYGARDLRVWPTGYAMYRSRITDWNSPGAYRATTADEDPHPYHLHISASQNPAGYESTSLWPLIGEAASSGTATPVQEGPFMTLPQPALDAMVHQVGVTDANVKTIYEWTKSTVLRVASIGATQATQAASLDALLAAVKALDTAEPGSVDPAALAALTEAISKLPAEVRAVFETQPLTIGGTAK